MRVVGGCVLLALLLLGCSTGTKLSSTLLHPSYSFSRDGGLQYRLPAGWFDASADSQAVGHAVLLIRNDYGATIAIDEVYLDASARGQLHQGGLVQIAQLMMSLSSWDHGSVLTDPPRAITLNGQDLCRYRMVATTSQDSLQVTLLDTGEKVYAVSVLLSGKGVGRDGVFGVLQDSFVGSLRW